MKMQKVLFYSDSSLFSGAEAVLCELVDKLVRRGFIDVRCAAPRSNRRLFDSLAAANGSREPIDVPSQPLRLAALQLYDPFRNGGVRRAIASEEWDVIVVNLGSVEYGIGPLLVRQEGARYLGFLHVPGKFREFGFRLAPIREALATIPFRRLDSVCVMTASAERTVQRSWPTTPGTIYRLPAPRPTLEPIPQCEARRRLGLPSGVLVGMAGRIMFKQKGQDVFIRAASLLRHRNPEFRFAIAGNGQDMGKLKQSLVELDLAGHVIVLGEVSEIEVFLSAIDIIAIPSLFEGLGLIALEALSLNVRGVASACDGLRDIWPKDWQVRPGDEVDLADGIERLLGLTDGETARGLADGRRLLESATTEDLGAAFEPVLRRVQPDPLRSAGHEGFAS